MATTLHCPKCGKPMPDILVARDVRPDTALIEMRCAGCGFADSTFLQQLPDDPDGNPQYGKLPEPEMGSRDHRRKDKKYEHPRPDPLAPEELPTELAQPTPANLAQPPANNL